MHYDSFNVHHGSCDSQMLISFYRIPSISLNMRVKLGVDRTGVFLAEPLLLGSI